MKTLIIIPAYNEMENIKGVVDNLIQNYPDYDYVVVNDASKDDTAQIARKEGYNLLDLPINLGLTGAFQTGLRYAYKLDYDAVIQLDGDGQHDPIYIPQMIEKMQQSKSNIVIGSRFKDMKKPYTLRMMGNHLIQYAIQITSHKKITDPTSGMRLFDRSVLKRLASNMNYGPEPDTISYLLRCGIKISEIQVKMHDRTAGVSYLNFGRSLLYMLNMFISILFIQFFRKKEE